MFVKLAPYAFMCHIYYFSFTMLPQHDMYYHFTCLLFLHSQERINQKEETPFSYEVSYTILENLKNLSYADLYST